MQRSSSTSSSDRPPRASDAGEEGDLGLPGLRRFVARFTLFLLPAAGAELALEARLASVENSYSIKRSSLEESLPSLEVLILGPSHAYYGIDPDHLSRPSINLANVSQSLQVDTQVASMVLARAPRLRLVMLSFGYFSLGYTTETGGEPWRNGFTHYFYGIDGDQPPWMLLHPRNYSLLALYGPEQVRGMALRGFTSTLADHVSPRGFYAAEPRPASLILDEKDGEKRVRTHESLQVEEARGENAAALRAMLATLAARNVKAAFVTLPVHASYARFMDREVWRKSQAVIRAMVKEGAVSYHDYLEDGRFGVEDFRDHDHLCAAGAAKMTRILEEEVVKAELAP